MALFKRTRKALAVLMDWDSRTVSKRLKELGIDHSGALSHAEWCKFLVAHYPEKVPAEYTVATKKIASSAANYSNLPLFAFSGNANS